MANTLHYRDNLRDTLFNLFEYLDIGRTSLGKAPFGELDEPTARQTLASMLTVCKNELQHSYLESDKVPLSLDQETGNVTLPPGLRKAYGTYFDTGLNAIDLPAKLGGLGAPPSLMWAAFEFLSGSNSVLAFYFLGNVLSRIIDELGTEAQKQRFVGPMLEKRWGGTMVLTEPDAGSDVGAGRTKAIHVKDDLWHLEGVKRFITSGDFDAVENIIHLVLARPEGAGPGTKGLSMFIVPKFLVNDDGSLGARNGVYCTNIEKKMGLKGSATCEMTFGERGPAQGWLVGNVHDGIRQMFHVIEHARMAIGMKSMATLSTGYLNALAYAKERVQSADLKAGRDKSAPRVRIIQHPDVRRMLLLQKAHAEGMRALCLFNASVQDDVELKGGHSAPEAAESDALNDLLLPVIKGYNSEKAYELLALSLQTFGGSGYLQDYPIEQYIRDQKIDTLYEGTTHIQALDLLMRKVAKDGGQTLQRLLGRIADTVGTGAPELAEERALLGAGLTAMQTAFGALMEKLGESLYHVGLQGNRVLAGLAELIIGWLLIEHAQVALKKQGAAQGDDVGFYEGKVASARFYAREVLPNLAMVPEHVKRSSLVAMDVPEAAF